jgi:chemotaxis regulatin CheY-phosphate phosphatase CheZ
MRLEPEVRKRYIQWAQGLIAALEAEDETRTEQMFTRLGKASAWSLGHAVDRYIRAATEAINQFSSALAVLQETRPVAGATAPRELDALVLLSEDSVHRTLDAVERAFGELDQLRDALPPQAQELHRGIDRTRLALREVLVTQSFQDQLGQLLGRCVHLVDTFAAQLDVLLHFTGEPSSAEVQLLSQLGEPARQRVSQEEVDALLRWRDDLSHGS